MNALAVYLALVIGFFFGFGICALLTAGRNADQRMPRPDEHEQFPEGKR